VQVEAPANCQDGVYTANWGLVRDGKVIPSVLPNKRQGEMAHARTIFTNLGLEIIEPPHRAFSGQGDALPCGNYLFMGSGYRTDWRVHEFVREKLGFEVISLQTIPQLQDDKPVINAVTGWPDSFFYDIDLALSVISPELIAWCPDAFVPWSQEVIRKLPIEKIEVSYEEAVKGFACNLVSTGETVIMSDHAPQLKAALEQKGIKTITPTVTELLKGGGYIRCVSLALDTI
jgi:N-dimethylarginine dimethylaminohydrolase